MSAASWLPLTAQEMLHTAIEIHHLETTEEASLPDPELLLADPQSLLLPPRADQQLALLHSVAVAVARAASSERWARGREACVCAARQGAVDVALTAARTFAVIRPAWARLPAGHEILSGIHDELLDSALSEHSDDRIS